MESISYIFGAIIAAFLLVFIAEPQRFMPEYEPKKKKVGSTYWGIYEGNEVEEPEELRTVELQKVARPNQYAAGSTTYALGRGVNMSGRK
ncbi:MAG TPA: hypothetical protein V6C81_01995 [Planktothrix sp.]|jgi:hypothetical protein